MVEMINKMKRAYAVMQLRAMSATLISLEQDYAVTQEEVHQYALLLDRVNMLQAKIENAKEMM